MFRCISRRAEALIETRDTSPKSRQNFGLMIGLKVRTALIGNALNLGVCHLAPILLHISSGFLSLRLSMVTPRDESAIADRQNA